MKSVIIFLLFTFSCSAFSDKDNEEIWGKPYAAYSIGSCGDFIRSSIKSTASERVRYNYFEMYARGYVTGINSELGNGGNILGSTDVTIPDFMILVENYCRNNPTGDFLGGLSVSLKKFTPTDYQGNPYKK